MANGKIMLCADEASILHPELIGLEGEQLESQSWMTVFSDAEQARSQAALEGDGLRAWIAGSEQMEGINLAAAIKSDRPQACVQLLDFSGSGSVLSRARAAGVDGVLDKRSFLDCYRAEKKSHERKLEDGRDTKRSGDSDGARPTWNDMLANTPARVLVDSGEDLEAAFAPSKTGELFSAGIARPYRAEGPDKARGFLLAVIGAGGGTGKSSVATLCACCAQEAGHPSVLLDADLQFGDIAFLSGSESVVRSDELLEAPLRMDGLPLHGRIPAVVGAPKRMEHSELVAKHLGELVGALRQKFDVVVVNTGANWVDGHLSLIESCNNALFVLDQRPSSVRACKHALELCSRCGIASKPFLFALNRCSRKSLFSSIDVSCALQGSQVFELKDGGGAVEETLGAGRPFDLIDDANPFARSVAEMMSCIVVSASAEAGEIAVPKKRGRHLFRRKARS